MQRRSTIGLANPLRHRDSVSVVAFTVVCPQPRLPVDIRSGFSRAPHKIDSFATVTGDRWRPLGWTKGQHGNNLLSRLLSSTWHGLIF